MNQSPAISISRLNSTLVVLVGLCLFSAIGCARFVPEENTSREISLPKSRMTADSVALEVAVAQLDHLQSDLFEEFFRETDSLKFPLDVRKRLDRNGFRVSVMGSRTSATFDDLIKPRPVDPTGLNEFDKQLYDEGMLNPAPRLQLHRRLESQDGESYPVTVSKTYPSMQWKLLGDEITTSHSARNARGVIKVTTFPQANGTVRLVFSPEIHFGVERSRIGIAEKNFAFEDRQLVKPIEALRFDIVINAGETVLVAPTQQLGELGELFFGHPVEIENEGWLIEKIADSIANVESVSTEEFFPMLNDEMVTSADQSSDNSQQKAKLTAGDDDLQSLDAISDEMMRFQETIEDGESEASQAIAKLEREISESEIEDLDEFAELVATKAGFIEDREKAALALEDNSPKPLHRFLLVRLLQTQMDDLFGSANALDRLSTTAE